MLRAPARVLKGRLQPGWPQWLGWLELVFGGRALVLEGAEVGM